MPNSFLSLAWLHGCPGWSCDPHVWNHSPLLLWACHVTPTCGTIVPDCYALVMCPPHAQPSSQIWCAQEASSSPTASGTPAPSRTATTSPTPSITPSPSFIPAAAATLSGGAKIGVGVGAAFGVLGLIGLAIMYNNRHKGAAPQYGSPGSQGVGSVTLAGVTVDSEAERQAQLQREIEAVSFHVACADNVRMVAVACSACMGKPWMFATPDTVGPLQ
jgi:hypothetical protein